MLMRAGKSRGPFLVCCAAGLLAAAAASNKSSQVSLIRPDDPQDFDAVGTLSISEKGSVSTFEVQVQKVAPNQELNLWIEEPDDSADFVDVGPLSGGATKKLKFETKKGGGLPLGAPSLDELFGREVRVQHGVDVVLYGTVPGFDLPSKPQKATAEIEAPIGSPADDMHAKLILRSKPAKGLQRIELKARKVPWADVLLLVVFVEDEAGSGVFVNEGALLKQGAKGGRWSRDTKKGESLPAGASVIGDLGGRLIEVRRASDDEVLLRGTIPQVD